MLLSAELTSAAVCLVTIEERLQSAGCRTSYGAFKDLIDKVRDKTLLADAFKRQLDEFLHILLRGNVAHVEPSHRGGAAHWRARQEVLRSETLRGQASTLGNICRRIEELLRARGVIA